MELMFPAYGSLQLGDMEHWVDGRRCGQIEPVGHGTNEGDDGIGAKVFRGQLLTTMLGQGLLSVWSYLEIYPFSHSKFHMSSALIGELFLAVLGFHQVLFEAGKGHVPFG